MISEKRFLTDFCLVSRAAVSEENGVPQKAFSPPVRTPCLVCQASAGDKTRSGAGGGGAMWLVKLPASCSLAPGDIVEWRGTPLSAVRTNCANSRRFLTVAWCRGAGR